MRSLAVFRIALGGVVLVDHLLRARFLAFHYTDAGYLPRALVGTPPPLFQLHLLDGSLAWQSHLFLAGITLALLLIVGRWTRIVTPLCWIVVGSLNVRNIYLLDGGDFLLLTLLLWSMFLPLGACWSLDARRRRTPIPPDKIVLSPASVALLLQLVFVYVHAGALKSDPAWEAGGNALALALGQSYWAGPLNDLLLRFEAYHGLMAPAVVWFEILAPLLLFSPVFTGPVRVATVVAFWVFQAFLGLGIQLHLFPVVNTVATLVFLPGWLWERLPGRAGRLPRASAPSGAPERGAVRVWGGRAAQGLVVILLALASLQFLDGLGVISAKSAADQIYAKTGMLQRWTLYAPKPTPWDPSFRVVGYYADGSRGEVLARERGETWERVRELHETYRFKYYQLKNAVIEPRQVRRTSAYLRWLCRQWNRDAPPEQRLVKLELRARFRTLDGASADRSERRRVGKRQRCVQRDGARRR